MTSKVLYFDKLPSQWTDATLRAKLAPYGSVKRVVLLRKRNAIYAGYNPTTLEPIRSNCVQALVEAADIATAAVILKLLENNPLKLTEDEDTGSPIVVSYSKNQELRDRNAGGARGRHQNSDEENRILLVSVQNPTYPITTDLIYDIFRTYGCVEKVVIFMKSIGLQCLVQFATVEEAVAAKNGLNTLSIFPDCCTLVIHFSNLPQELIVNENGLRTKDFTNPDLPSTAQDHAVNSSSNPNAGFLPQYPSGAPESPIIPGLGREVLSPVLLVCNLRDSVTCDQLFNLFSCYGNVARVKKLAGKSDHALIQFASQVSAQSAVVHLRGFTLLGRSLEISYSKHSYIAIRPSTANSTTEFQGGAMKEYGNGVNRFTGKYANVTKHIYSPTKILHISNLDETTTEEEVKDHLALYPNGDHVRISMFSNANGHLQALADFPSVDAATNVLASAHNELLGTRRLKIAFSKKPVRAGSK